MPLRKLDISRSGSPVTSNLGRPRRIVVVVAQFLTLIRMVRQQLGTPRDGMTCRLVPGTGEEVEEVRELVRREALAVDFGCHQDRSDVVSRVLTPVPTQSKRVLVHLHDRRIQLLEGEPELRIANSVDEVRPLEDLCLVARRNSEHVADQLERKRRGEMLDEIELHARITVHGAHVGPFRDRPEAPARRRARQ